jgi:hypothetical protein
LGNILKEQVTRATPTGKSHVIIDVDSPTKNKHMSNATVNAFELMMERSKACERQGVKRRSLFQPISKVV